MRAARTSAPLSGQGKESTSPSRRKRVTLLSSHCHCCTSLPQRRSIGASFIERTPWRWRVKRPRSGWMCTALTSRHFSEVAGGSCNRMDRGAIAATVSKVGKTKVVEVCKASRGVFSSQSHQESQTSSLTPLCEDAAQNSFLRPLKKARFFFACPDGDKAEEYAGMQRKKKCKSHRKATTSVKA